MVERCRNSIFLPFYFAQSFFYLIFAKDYIYLTQTQKKNERKGQGNDL